jgi:ABC-type branched-subunit amino acid transport system ATPase component/branched-subunit amino acid ABC-type transport system permease component
MSDYLPFIISGIATGAIFGLAGTGLVLTYKTSGLFNFGHGALATIAAYVFYALQEEFELEWGWAFVISVVVLGPLMGLVMERIAAHLAPQRIALQIVGTVGLILAVQGLATISYGANPLRIQQFLPYGTETFEAFGVVITFDLVIITGIALVAVAALYGLFRFTRLGVAMRGVVDDPDLLAMQGTNPQRVRRAAWIIGATFAALSGVLVIPLIGLEPIGLTFLVVQAFGAAAVGAFSSIPLTFVGGILIGVGADVSKTWVLDVPWLAGLPSALPFIVLFIALLVLPKSKLTPPTRAERRPPLQYRAAPRLRVGLAVVVLVPLLLIPQMVGSDLPFYTVALIQAIMLLSLGLLVRTSGQVSLMHAAFAAIGAVAFAQFHTDLGLPWLVAALLGALVAVPVGALIALPAIRLSGLFLALATFGFGILVQQLLYSQNWMFTVSGEGRRMPRPEWASTGTGFYYVVLVALVLVAAVVVVIQRSRLGRMLQGMSDSPTAVGAMGLSTNVTKLIVFCVSAFIAGLAGILLGVSRVFATGSDVFFTPFFSLLLLAMLALAPFAEPWYALVAFVGVLPAYIPGDDTVPWINTLFGVFAVLVAMQGGTPPMPDRLRALLDRLGGRKPRDAAEIRADADLVGEPAALPADRTGLVVSDLRVRFGGLTAVDELSFEAPTGRITGLIGPNGAGKTTTFNACSGLNRRFQGTVRLHGHDITSASPAVRGRLGLGRTFQRMELCETLTVADNVLLGRECAQAGSGPFTQMAAPPAEWREARASAAAAMELCGITELADVQVGSLSTGQRRLVELARCLAGPFDVLLLDEVSSGLDTRESARLGRILQRVVHERGVGILLVEHDMGLVMDICQYIYVLDFGRPIFEGTPADVAGSHVVRAAYLGDVDEELAPPPGEPVASTTCGGGAS